MASKSRTVGIYVGVAVDPDFDVEEAFARWRSQGYDTVSVFLTTVYYNTGCWPWPLVNGRFDFTQVNQAYYEQYRRLLRASHDYGIRLHICLFDQFHAGDGMVADPFAQAFTDIRQLYESYLDGKYWWLAWNPQHDPKPGELQDFRPVGVVGQALVRYIRKLALITKTFMNNHPGFVPPSVKVFNETLAQKNADGHVVGKRGDRDEIFIFVKATWEKVGIQTDWYFDYICLNAGKHKTDPDYVAYDVVRNAFRNGVRKKHNAKLELHGILSEHDADMFGFTAAEKQYVKFSTDGDAQMVADYPGLGHSDLPDVDLKFDFRPGETAPTVQAMYNKLIDRYDHYVEKKDTHQ